MADTAKHLAMGIMGEEKAARLLAGKGWRILTRNWRPRGAERGLELDIVAMHADCLVFVEVKTRRVPHDDTEEKRHAGQVGERNTFSAGEERALPLLVPPRAALTPAKQKKLIRAAGHYLTVHDLWNRPCRFDLVCIEEFPDGQSRLEHHSDVIELRQVVGGGDAAWQPW